MKPTSYKIAWQGIAFTVCTILVAVIIGLISTLQVNRKEKDKADARLKVIADLYELKIDSIQTMHIVDSLAYHDSINKYKVLANANLIINIKKDRDEVIGRISSADNNERDQLWATYSPKN
jgi:signal transduction histidine kinase